MFNDKVVLNAIEQSDPVQQLSNKEVALNVLSFGSFITILNNKRINPVFLFSSILENMTVRDLFVHITGTENAKEALLHLLHFYPALIKSKNTKRLFKKSLKPLKNASN
jgi:hypothetical protein